VMTRTTLKALWFGGGGVLATWLAVSPTNGTPPASRTSESQTAHSEQQGSQLLAQADQLRQLTTAVTVRPSTRNPFRFSSPKSEAPLAGRLREVPQTEALGVPSAPAFPPLSLAGVAQDAGKRTAIITSGTQMYLASEGDTVAGTMTIVRVDAESVLLRDVSGAELQLQLPR
jgi:hypothetical protein